MNTDFVVRKVKQKCFLVYSRSTFTTLTILEKNQHEPYKIRCNLMSGSSFHSRAQVMNSFSLYNIKYNGCFANTMDGLQTDGLQTQWMLCKHSGWFLKCHGELGIVSEAFQSNSIT